MIIVIYGSEEDKSLNDTLLRALAKYGGVQFHCKDKIISYSEQGNPKYLVYDVNKLPLFLNCEGILILKNSFKDIDDNYLPSNFLPVFDNQNLKAVKFLKDRCKIVLTCGVSSKNTLSISSIDESSAVVSLQRYMIIKNKIVEPHDFTINLTKQVEPQDLLFTCAILLLSDIPSMDGYEF